MIELIPIVKENVSVGDVDRRDRTIITFNFLRIDIVLKMAPLGTRNDVSSDFDLLSAPYGQLSARELYTREPC